MGYISKHILFGGRIIINENIHTVIYIIFLQHIVICLRRENKKMHNNLFFMTRVTHTWYSVSNITVYRFTRYGYSLYHLIKHKKKEEIYNGQS